MLYICCPWKWKRSWTVLHNTSMTTYIMLSLTYYVKQSKIVFIVHGEIKGKTYSKSNSSYFRRKMTPFVQWFLVLDFRFHKFRYLIWWHFFQIFSQNFVPNFLQQPLVSNGSRHTNSKHKCLFLWWPNSSG